MNTEQARFNMVEQQIRTWNVLDADVLDLLFMVKREEFVPAAYRSLAFADLEIPLGNGPAQQMWPPKLEARVIQELHLRPDDEVLEIGTGSGYLSALLAHRAAHVTSVEIDSRLADEARSRLSAHNLTKVNVEVGDGARGWRTNQMFDVIVLTGSTPELADDFIRQLKPAGRLFAVVGVDPAMHGRIYAKGVSGQATPRDLFETVIAPLVNAPHPERFVF